MRHPLRFAIALSLTVICCTAPARAQFPDGTMHLAWNRCSSAGGRNQTFACDANPGNDMMVASYVAPPGIEQLVGIEASVDVVLESATLPAADLFNRISYQTPAQPDCDRFVPVRNTTWGSIKAVFR